MSETQLKNPALAAEVDEDLNVSKQEATTGGAEWSMGPWPYVSVRSMFLAVSVAAFTFVLMSGGTLELDDDSVVFDISFYSLGVKEIDLTFRARLYYAWLAPGFLFFEILFFCWIVYIGHKAATTESLQKESGRLRTLFAWNTAVFELMTFMLVFLAIGGNSIVQVLLLMGYILCTDLALINLSPKAFNGGAGDGKFTFLLFFVLSVLHLPFMITTYYGPLTRSSSTVVPGGKDQFILVALLTYTIGQVACKLIVTLLVYFGKLITPGDASTEERSALVGGLRSVNNQISYQTTQAILQVERLFACCDNGVLGAFKNAIVHIGLWSFVGTVATVTLEAVYDWQYPLYSSVGSGVYHHLVGPNLWRIPYAATFAFAAVGLAWVPALPWCSEALAARFAKRRHDAWVWFWQTSASAFLVAGLALPITGGSDIMDMTATGLMIYGSRMVTARIRSSRSDWTNVIMASVAAVMMLLPIVPFIFAFLYASTSEFEGSAADHRAVGYVAMSLYLLESLLLFVAAVPVHAAGTADGEGADMTIDKVKNRVKFVFASQFVLLVNIAVTFTVSVAVTPNFFTEG